MEKINAVNLMPWRDLKKIRKRTHFFIYLSASMLLTLTIFFIFDYYLEKSIESKSCLSNHLKKILAALSIKNNDEQFSKKYKNMQNKLSVIAMSHQRINDIITNLKMIGKLISMNSYLTLVNFEHKKIILEGYALNLESLNNLIKNFSKSHNFKHITLTNLKNNNGIYFEIKIDVK